MSNRKTTPDVLGEVLGAVRPATPEAPIAASPPRADAKPARTARADTSMRTDASARMVTPKPAALEWEYLTVVLGEHHGLRPKTLNGQSLETWKTQPLLSDFLTIVGRYGWEMAGIVEVRCGEKEAYFKRPKRT